MHVQRPVRLIALCAVAASCSARDVSTDPRNAAFTEAAPVFSIGDWRRASPRSPCAASTHRQFDFWLGTWDVRVPTGELDGTNNVTVDLDGCAVEEHWTDATGFRGRSLNAFDPATGQWHQHWVTETGANTLFSGALESPGRMVMVAAPRFSGGNRLDQRNTWIRESADLVRQIDETSTSAAPWSISWEGLYNRVVAVTPLPAPGLQVCTVTFPVYRTVDWVLGTWTVSIDRGPVVGSSTVRTDLSGCLIEERLTTSKGIRTLTFLTYRRGPRDWVRTYVDSEGHWLQLFGTVIDGALVQTGTTVQNGTEVSLRVTTRPSADGFQEAWEQSTDGGTTWQVSDVFAYAR